MICDDVKVKIRKSTVPIIWLDTSIITNIAQWKHDLCSLDKIQEERISKLYDQIYEYTRAGKLICPLAEQEAEIWVERDKWLDTMNLLSLGIETEALQAIHDKQFHIFMKASVDKDREVILSYDDAFHSDPVEELMETLSDPFNVNVKMPILFGEDFQKRLKQNLLNELNEQRKRNVQAKVPFETQLEAEYMGELNALLILKKKFISGNWIDEEEKFNSICGAINLNRQLEMCASLTGKAQDYEGLIGFYKSQYCRSMPYTNISCNMTARIMIDKQPIKSGDMMDIKHASTLMPYSDLFVTDRAMSAFLRNRKFDELYNTTVCYIGDTGIIDAFFGSL